MFRSLMCKERQRERERVDEQITISYLEVIGRSAIAKVTQSFGESGVLDLGRNDSKTMFLTFTLTL